MAAVGPYIQSSTMPRGPVRHDLLVKPAYPDGTATLPAHDPQSKAGTGEQQGTTCHLKDFKPFPFLNMTQTSAAAALAADLHFYSFALCLTCMSSFSWLHFSN